MAGKTVGGKEFQSLDVIGINEFANAFVRLVVRVLENSLFHANEAFGGIINFISSE